MLPGSSPIHNTASRCPLIAQPKKRVYQCSATNSPQRFTAEEESIWAEISANVIKEHMLKAVKDDGRLSDRSHSTLRDRVNARVRPLPSGADSQVSG